MQKSFQTSDSFAGPFRGAVCYSLAEHEHRGEAQLINNTFSAASD